MRSAQPGPCGGAISEVTFPGSADPHEIAELETAQSLTITDPPGGHSYIGEDSYTWNVVEDLRVSAASAAVLDPDIASFTNIVNELTDTSGNTGDVQTSVENTLDCDQPQNNNRLRCSQPSSDVAAHLEASGLSTPEHLINHWEADWIRAFVDRSIPEAWFDDQTTSISTVVDGCEIRVLGCDPRLGQQVSPISPTVLVRPNAEMAFFDTREWLELFDGSSHLQLVGADQLVVLDYLDRIRRFSGPVEELRRVRRRWVAAQGSRAFHDDQPAWPDSVDAPGWLAELDLGLVEAGFDSGWTVKVGGVEPIGVVRQRGPLRVQLTVLDGEPLVQIALWPRKAWLPLAVIAERLGFDAPSDTTGVIELGEHFCELIFATGSALFQWTNEDRLDAARTSPNWEAGPYPHQAYSQLVMPAPYRFFNTDDLGAATKSMRWLSTWLGGPGNRVRCTKTPLASVSTSGSGYFYVTQQVRDLVQVLIPEARFFEFSADGVPCFVPIFDGSRFGNPTDYARSVMALPFRAAEGRFVVDPRQLERPNDLGTLINYKGWVVDSDAAERFAELGVKSTPTWVN